MKLLSNEEKIQYLNQVIKNAKKIVFFGGAGVSTASGISDFRSEKGLYNIKSKYGVSYEEMLSHDYFFSHTLTFYKFYKEVMINLDAKPNLAHYALAKFEKENPNKLTIITQNIDNLHQEAGSKNVLELHGSEFRNNCIKCGEFYDINYILDSSGLPKCKKCGGLVKPDVVLYQEQLDENVLDNAIKACKEADVMIVGGTSLMVYPAAYLIQYFYGKALIMINRQVTPYDSYANYVFHDDITKVLPLILE